MLRLLVAIVVASSFLLAGCGILEEHERRDGETVYRIKPETAARVALAVGSVIPDQPASAPTVVSSEPHKTNYSLEVTGAEPSVKALTTITTGEVSICLSESDCLNVIDSFDGQITGDFNGFEFVLGNPEKSRFFHSEVGQVVIFALAPGIAPEAILANVYVKNLGNNNFEVKLRVNDYPEYDIDASLRFDEQGQLVSCEARRLSTGERAIIEDAPPNT